MRSRRFLLSSLLVSALAVALTAQSANKGGIGSIQEGPLREWLTYLSSDQLQGRATYSEGLGLAAAYIADRLQEAGVKPAGDNGSYFQVVKVQGMRTTSRASVTVEVNGQTRTFKDGAGITFPRNMGEQAVGGCRTRRVRWLRHEPRLAQARRLRQSEREGRSCRVARQRPETRGRRRAPAAQQPCANRIRQRRCRDGQSGRLWQAVVAAVEHRRPKARARIRRRKRRPANAVRVRVSRSAGQGQGQGFGRGAADDGDFTTVQRLDNKVPPAVNAQDEFFEFLFSASEFKYADLKQRASNQEALAPFVLKNVKMTFNVDADYEVVRTRYTRNVVGIVEGSDPALKNTYVLYGAHYDHTGYREGAPRAGGDAEDRINNGADDDGSGTRRDSRGRAGVCDGAEAEAIAAVRLARGRGKQASSDRATTPTIRSCRLDNIVAVINIDMIGRNRDDDPKQANTVLVVGSDRISTELHNINEDANASLAKPLTLDYEMNDPADPQSIYTRSDHYSYASKGIPIIFFFTGHPP